MEFEKLVDVSNREFKRLVGIKYKTFKRMVKIITEAEKIKKAKGGRPSDLSVENRILMTLEYWREYRTYFHIGVTYGYSESAAFQCIRWIENTLIKSNEFKLPGKKTLLQKKPKFKAVLMDVAESPIERPKKGQRKYYSGKKKRHTIKAQVVVDQKTQKVICTAFEKGKCHDFRMYKESKVRFMSNIMVLTDTGYQGLQKLHEKTLMPKKKLKKSL